MKVLRDVEQVNDVVSQWKNNGEKIGFVPTMGYLHEGHMRLLEEARKENDRVILSIFINPLQFSQGEDLETYPRDEARDQKIAEENGVDMVFLPTKEMMYPRPLSVQMSVTKRTDVLCGRSRPGHFDGVVTVLAKLFNLTRPDTAYFGMKDAQQVAVVDALIKDYNIPVKLVPVPTVREDDGLAKSSRNVRLSKKERKEAPSIQAALQYGKQLVRDGHTSPEVVIKATEKFLETKTHGKIDYIELLSYPELEFLEEIDRPVILAAAVSYEHARLIDNVVFNKEGNEIYG
ncbi:pantoate--beta-alanine ligase [Halobacillus karajensis]|uniref:pantoate--beta-alanine ligase n=1 Tax=Halobacillus karajensis TaxID=195088 RepID=UPI0008A73A11|nr:pantoate--beta-alanine ligase [Halobacillus karajensis]SEH80891.1 pantoate--beta-alanine ligase [Halobacillus karajensis]